MTGIYMGHALRSSTIRDKYCTLKTQFQSHIYLFTRATIDTNADNNSHQQQQININGHIFNIKRINKNTNLKVNYPA